MVRVTIASLVLAIGLLSGCAAVQRGTTVAKWEKGSQQDLVLKALKSGEYALLRGSDFKPQFVVPLRKGDSIGFRRTGDKVMAVWGDESRELQDAKYYWNYRGQGDD